MSHITASNIGMDKALGNFNYFAREHTSACLGNDFFSFLFSISPSMGSGSRNVM